MNSNVCLQATRLTERHVTLVAREWLLSSMDPHVCLQAESKPCHIGCRMISLLYEFECAPLGYHSERKTFHIACRRMTSLLYGLACVTLGYLTLRKT
jgi:hypothetical protein